MREFYSELVAAKDRRDDAHQQMVSLAWHVEAMHRQQRLPSLASLLKRQDRPQGIQEQRVMLEAISQTYGLPLQRRKKGRRG